VGGLAHVFLATAHPAKFAEVVEPIIGQEIDKPGPLVEALSRRGRILPIAGTIEAVSEAINRQMTDDLHLSR
jgi:threonine synthase